MSGMTEQDAQYLLKFLGIKARERWDYDGRLLSLDEYRDAGMKGLVRALEKHQEGHPILFRTFARTWIYYAIANTLTLYGHWKIVKRAERVRAFWTLREVEAWIDASCKLRKLPPALQDYAGSVLRGEPDTQYAARKGLTKVQVSKRLKRWRALE